MGPTKQRYVVLKITLNKVAWYDYIFRTQTFNMLEFSSTWIKLVRRD